MITLNSKLEQLYVTKQKTAVVIGFILFYLILALISNKLILTEEMYFNYYDGQVDSERVSEVVSKTRRFNTIKAIWEPINHLLNVLGASICIYLGCLYNEEKLEFKRILGISLVSYLVFFIPAIVKFLYFNITPGLTILDYNRFYFGSLVFLTSNSDSFWIKSTLETFTLFEVIYWILLSYGLTLTFKWDFDRSIKLVLSSYLVGLIVWVVIRIYVKMIIFNLT